MESIVCRHKLHISLHYNTECVVITVYTYVDYSSNAGENEY